MHLFKIISSTIAHENCTCSSGKIEIFSIFLMKMKRLYNSPNNLPRRYFLPVQENCKLFFSFPSFYPIIKHNITKTFISLIKPLNILTFITFNSEKQLLMNLMSVILSYTIKNAKMSPRKFYIICKYRFLGRSI